MPKQIVSQSITVAPSLGTVLLDVTQNIDLYIINGTTTLLSNITIDADVSNGAPYTGLQYEFLYQAYVDITTNNTHFFVFGTELTQKQCQTQSTITATYNGSSWDVRIMPDFEESGFISNDMLESGPNTKYETLIIPVSFETDEICDNTIFFGYDCFLVKAFYTVTKEIEATDDALIQFQSAQSPYAVYDTFTIAGGTPINDIDAFSFTPGIDFSADAGLRIKTLKSTPGGKALVTLIVSK